MAQAISAQAAVPASRPEKKVRDAASSRCVLAGPWPSRATMHGIGAVAAAAGSWAPATPQLGIRRGVDQLLRCCGPAHVAAVARADGGPAFDMSLPIVAAVCAVAFLAHRWWSSGMPSDLGKPVTPIRTPGSGAVSAPLNSATREARLR